MHEAPIFCPLDVRLMISDMLRSTPTTLSVDCIVNSWTSQFTDCNFLNIRGTLHYIYTLNPTVTSTLWNIDSENNVVLYGKSHLRGII